LGTRVQSKNPSVRGSRCVWIFSGTHDAKIVREEGKFLLLFRIYFNGFELFK